MANSRTDATLEKKRVALQTALKQYVSEQYKPDDSSAGAYFLNGNLVIVISSEKPNLRNYWAGRWTSVWTIKNAATAKPNITGDIKVKDCNCILYTSCYFSLA